MFKSFINSNPIYCYFTLIFLIFYTGCATAPLTIDEAKKFEGNIADFIEKRFASGIGSRKIGDGAALYLAPANSHNELKRPISDLKAFCEAKGGSFAKIGELSASQLKVNSYYWPGQVFYGIFTFSAKAEQYFGYFYCKNTSPYEWNASIVPIKYTNKDPRNDLSGDLVEMRISAK